MDKGRRTTKNIGTPNLQLSCGEGSWGDDHARRHDRSRWTLDPGPWTLDPGPWTLDPTRGMWQCMWLHEATCTATDAHTSRHALGPDGPYAVPRKLQQSTRVQRCSERHCSAVGSVHTWPTVAPLANRGTTGQPCTYTDPRIDLQGHMKSDWGKCAVCRAVHMTDR